MDGRIMGRTIRGRVERRVSKRRKLAKRDIERA